MLVRFEHPYEDLTTVSQRIGFPENIAEIMKDITAKRGFRSDGSYREFFDERSRDVIHDDFSGIIGRLGYRF